MMGVPRDICSCVDSGNMSFITNASKPKLTLKEKFNSICYHAVHVTVAMGEAFVALISTKKNLADLLKKIPYGQVRVFLVDRTLGCVPQ